MKDILVLNGPSYYKAVRNFGNRVIDSSEFINNPKRFLFVLFTGGEDVSPELYGDTSPKGVCWYNRKRDAIEEKVFRVALMNKVSMVGICRGLQFLTVMAGGKLIHHLPNHAGIGLSDTHVMHLQDSWEGEANVVVNSYHHQMCLPVEGAKVLGWAPKRLAKGHYIGDKDLPVKYEGFDVEAMYIPSIDAFGVQWHPEMLSSTSNAYRWFNDKIAELIIRKKESNNLQMGA